MPPINVVDVYGPVYRLVAEGKDDDAGDLLFNLIDGLCWDQNWPAIDRLAVTVDLDRLNLQLMYSLLMMVRWAEPHIHGYGELYGKVLAKFVEKYGEVEANKELANFKPREHVKVQKQAPGDS